MKANSYNGTQGIEDCGYDWLYSTANFNQRVGEGYHPR